MSINDLVKEEAQRQIDIAIEQIPSERYVILRAIQDAAYEVNHRLYPRVWRLAISAAPVSCVKTQRTV